MKAWLLATVIAVSSLQLGAGAAALPLPRLLAQSGGKAKHLKISGHLTGRISLWPKEVVAVALMSETEADRLGVKVRADDLKRIKPVKTASLIDKALQGAYEFQEVASGHYRLVAFKVCAANVQDDAAVIGRKDVTVADRNVTETKLEISSSAAENEKQLMPLGMASGATPCGEITRQEEKAAKGSSSKAKTVVGKVVASSPMPTAVNVNAYLIEAGGRRFDQGLEIESRILIERQQQPVLTAGGTGRFEFSGVLPGVYRLDVRQIRMDGCTLTPVGIGREDVRIDASDLSIEIRVNWRPSADSAC